MKDVTSKLLGSFVMLLIIFVTLLPLMHSVYSQTTSSPVHFSTKGTVTESSNFHGVIMWTIINGDKGTIIIQSPVGRGMAHVSVSPSTNCDSSTPICLFSTVTDTVNNDAFKIGDTARFSIDLNAKQETVSLLTGILAGFDVTINLSKTWTASPTPHAVNMHVNSTTIANPASVYCINHGGKLDMRVTSLGQTGICIFPNGSECDEWSFLRGECSPTTTPSGINSTTSGINATTITNSTVPRHFTLNLNESVGIKVKS